MNKICKYMTKEMEAFIPVIRETYRVTIEYQLNRSEDKEIKVSLQLIQASKEL